MIVIRQTLKLHIIILSLSLAGLFSFSGEGISQTQTSHLLEKPAASLLGAYEGGEGIMGLWGGDSSEIEGYVVFDDVKGIFHISGGLEGASFKGKFESEEKGSFEFTLIKNDDQYIMHTGEVSMVFSRAKVIAASGEWSGSNASLALEKKGEQGSRGAIAYKGWLGIDRAKYVVNVRQLANYLVGTYSEGGKRHSFYGIIRDGCLSFQSDRVVTKMWLKTLVDSATRKNPFVNSLGMKFVPIITNINGKKVCFSIWETRVKDYRVFVEATGYDAEGEAWTCDPSGYEQGVGSWKEPRFPINEDHCVTCVSWFDAKVFAKWLTQKERREGLIGPNQEYRLPTDIEWSYAVGLGKEKGNTPDERNRNEKEGYPWGDYWPPKEGSEGNYAGKESYWGGAKVMDNGNWPMVEGGYTDNHPRTAPVGSYRVNKYGLYDMGGNVWEWCEDNYGKSEKYRAVRGSSWRYSPEGTICSSYRGMEYASSRSNGNGFRLVLAAKNEK